MTFELRPETHAALTLCLLSCAAFAGSGTRTEFVTDATLDNMRAYSVTLPSAWHFQGTLLQGAGLGHCLPYPQEVWRATSADGLSQVEQLPEFSWVHGTGPMAAHMPATGCLPLQKSLNAQDFLKYLAGTMQLAYAADEPIPAENAKAQQELADAQARSAAQWAALHLQAPKQTVELAQAAVSFKNGSFAMKGRLWVKIACTTTTHPGMKSILQGMRDTPPSVLEQCEANALFYSAPADRFAGLIEQWKTPGLGAQTMHDWGDAWVKQAAARSQRQTDAMIGAAQQRFNAQQDALRHTMAVQQQMHEQFLKTMQAGTDRSMARAADAANSNHRMAQDMVDYSLDRRTVMDPNTGQVSKVSSAYGNTWVDGTGKTSYQTNDPNANPNGVLPGSWTRQTVVHGDAAVSP